MRRIDQVALAATALAVSAAATASETITYSYDALGRLVAVSTAGGPNDGTAASTLYDPAGNRTNYSVAGAGPAGLTAPASGSTPEAPAPIEGAAAEEPGQEAPAADVIPSEEEADAGEPDRSEEVGTPEGGR